MASVIFMGTPDFAVPTLRALLAQHDVLCVVTQPDRPAGRGGQIRQSPVKLTALAHGIPIFQPERLRRAEAVEQLKVLGVPDFYVVAAFGQILPQPVLDIPRYGSINVHASLLPRWRGAAPIQAAIRAGDAETGITIMLMDAGLDTGPILSQRSLPILPDDTGQTLHDKLAALGGDLLLQTLPGFRKGEIKPQEQDDAYSTYAPMIAKDAGRIDWAQDAASIERTVRAFTPWPGTFTFWNGKQLKIHAGAVLDGSAPPGVVLVTPHGVGVGTTAGIYLLAQVQLEGKKSVSSEQFLRGHSDFVGATLD